MWGSVLVIAGCGSSGTLVIPTEPTDAIPTDTAAPPAETAPVTVATADTAGPSTTEPTMSWSATVEPWGFTVALRTELPFDAAACEALDAGLPCFDDDADGLADVWEQAVLDLLAPQLEFDEDEPMHGDASAVFAGVGRVAPARDEGRIRAYFMLGYSQDYGACLVDAHDGDSERVVLDLEPISGAGAGDVGVVRAYTAAHENTLDDQGQVFSESEVAQLEFPEDEQGVPRWKVWASEAKHATYPSVRACESVSSVPCVEEDCAADGRPPVILVPAMVNAGEENARLIDALGPIGFPGELAWGDQDFCGGLRPSLVCAAPVREKLLADPFR